MIDLHSHILPCMDDGSKSVGESLKLLKMLKEQGIDTVVATPHFYADKESVADFVVRRKLAFDTLKQQLPDGYPQILLGAEVNFYSGISRMEDIKKLCIEESNVLLLEMPFTKWTEFDLKEVTDLVNIRNLTVVLAHMERYLVYQNNNVWRRLLESGVLIQANATFFTDFFTRRKAISLIKNHSIHFLGSDCHDEAVRPPCMGAALEIIKKKMGGDFINLMTEFAEIRLSLGREI